MLFLKLQIGSSEIGSLYNCRYLLLSSDLVGEYIACGASSVVLSDAIFDKEAMSQRNFGAIYKFAKLAASLGSKAVERF